MSVEVERAATKNYTSRQGSAETESDSSITFKKIPTFTDKYSGENGSETLQNKKDNMVGSKTPSSTKPTGFSYGYKNWESDSNMIGKSKIETDADAWEKEQMMKAKNRY